MEITATRVTRVPIMENKAIVAIDLISKLPDGTLHGEYRRYLVDVVEYQQGLLHQIPLKRLVLEANYVEGYIEGKAIDSRKPQDVIRLTYSRSRLVSSRSNSTMIDYRLTPLPDSSCTSFLQRKYTSSNADPFSCLSCFYLLYKSYDSMGLLEQEDFYPESEQERGYSKKWKEGQLVEEVRYTYDRRLYLQRSLIDGATFQFIKAENSYRKIFDRHGKLILKAKWRFNGSGKVSTYLNNELQTTNYVYFDQLDSPHNY